jgi:hypothetical protein
MERFKIDARQATIAVRNLGNASPAGVVIDCTMGSAEVDLRGAWRADADILLETKMVRGSLRLPEDVHVEGLPGWRPVPIGELPAPTLRFEVEARAGGLAIEE